MRGRHQKPCKHTAPGYFPASFPVLYDSRSFASNVKAITVTYRILFILKTNVYSNDCITINCSWLEMWLQLALTTVQYSGAPVVFSCVVRHFFFISVGMMS